MNSQNKTLFNLEKEHVFLVIDQINVLRAPNQQCPSIIKGSLELRLQSRKTLSEIQIMNEECKMYLLKVTITWDIPFDAVPGNYRIVHLGHYKHILRGITPYQGSSRIFRVGSEIKQNQGNF